MSGAGSTGAGYYGEPLPDPLLSISPDGPTDLTLGALWVAAWSGPGWRWILGWQALGAGTILAGWTFAVTFFLSCASAGLLRGRVVFGAELAVLALWSVAVSTVGFRLAAGLAGSAVGGVRDQFGDRGPYFPAWGGRFAACGAPLVACAATSVMLPFFGLTSFGLPVEAAAIAAGLALLIVPAALFVAFWPAPFLIQDREELTGLRPLAAAWRFPDGVRAEATAAGLLAYALLAWPLGLFLGGVLVAPNTPVPFYTVGATVLFWPFTAPPAFLLLAHAHDRIARLDAAAAGPEDAAPAG